MKEIFHIERCFYGFQMHNHTQGKNWDKHQKITKYHNIKWWIWLILHRYVLTVIFVSINDITIVCAVHLVPRNFLKMTNRSCDCTDTYDCFKPFQENIFSEQVSLVICKLYSTMKRPYWATVKFWKCKTIFQQCIKSAVCCIQWSKW